MSVIPVEAAWVTLLAETGRIATLASTVIARIKEIVLRKDRTCFIFIPPVNLVKEILKS
jgi:hypothetical protein